MIALWMWCCLVWGAIGLFCYMFWGSATGTMTPFYWIAIWPGMIYLSVKAKPYRWATWKEKNLDISTFKKKMKKLFEIHIEEE